MKELDKMFQLAKDIRYIFVENKDTLNDLGFPFFIHFLKMDVKVLLFF